MFASLFVFFVITENMKQNKKLTTIKYQLTFLYCYMKRYFKIDQQLAQHLEYYGACLSSLCSQIITTIFNSISPTIRKQGWNFSQL